MQNRLIAPFALVLLITPLLACSLLRNKTAYKWHLTLEIDPSVSNREAVTRETVAVLKDRLNRVGVARFRVEIIGAPENGRLRVDMGGTEDPERIKNLIASRGLLQLVHIVSDPSPRPCQTYATEEQAKTAIKESQAISENRKVLRYAETYALPNGNVRWVVSAMPAIVEGRDLRGARAVPLKDEQYEVFFNLTADAADRFGAWTAANINQYLGVVLNDEVKSVAFIKSQIHDSGVIAGNFTRQSAEDLALVLSAGPLPATVKIVEEGQN